MTPTRFEESFVAPAAAVVAASLAAGWAAGWAAAAWLPALAALTAGAVAAWWTERRRRHSAADRALRGPEDLAAMVAALPVGVLALDERRQVLFANAELLALVGADPAAETPATLAALVDHPGFREAVDLTFLARDPVNLEFVFEASSKEVDYRGRRQTLGGRPAIVALLRDNTEMRRLETVRQDFIANVSHELKTPLTAIRALTETLLDGGVDQPEVLRRFLGRIDEQSARLHALVIDMLTLARAESHEPGYVLQTFDVRELVRDGVEGFRPDSEVKGVRLAVSVGPEPCLAKADVESTQTILRNLVDNAVKYTPAGGEVRVSVAAVGDRVELAVTDTGVGIPEQDLGRVFERFYRVDKARSRELGGTGLGLSIVKHLAHAFGGSVDVASAPGAGSTFTVRWPRADGRDAAADDRRRTP